MTHPMDSLTHYLTDPQHVSEQIQSLYERVSAIERHLATLERDRPMPSLPLRPCTASGCPNLSPTGRCPQHPRAERPAPTVRLYDDRRGSSTQRGYGSQWQTFRKGYLTRYPACRQCGQPATDIDHIVPKRWGGTDDEANLQPLCKRHHNAKTAQERRKQ